MSIIDDLKGFAIGAIKEKLTDKIASKILGTGSFNVGDKATGVYTDNERKTHKVKWIDIYIKGGRVYQILEIVGGEANGKRFGLAGYVTGQTHKLITEIEKILIKGTAGLVLKTFEEGEHKFETDDVKGYFIDSFAYSNGDTEAGPEKNQEGHWINLEIKDGLLTQEFMVDRNGDYIRLDTDIKPKLNNLAENLKKVIDEVT